MGVRLERPPLPGTIPLGSKVVVEIDDAPARRGWLRGALAASVPGRPMVLVEWTDGDLDWVPRSSVSPAPPSFWRRVLNWLRGVVRS
jgi:hypothetical protein